MVLDRLLPIRNRNMTAQTQPETTQHLIEMVDVVKNYVMQARASENVAAREVK